MRRFLTANPGAASQVRQDHPLPGYSDDELAAILADGILSRLRSPVVGSYTVRCVGSSIYPASDASRESRGFPNSRGAACRRA